jgi:tripartite-type tricarboxylate transporter receptor subunit TctC
MMTFQRARRTTLTALAALAAWPLLALAQADKSVRFILPVATASGVDTITRAAQPALQKALGRTVIVDNQAPAASSARTTS